MLQHKVVRYLAATAAISVLAPAALAGAIEPPVVPPGPPPPDPSPSSEAKSMRQVEDCTHTTVMPGSDLRELPAAWKLLDMPAAWRLSTGAGVVVGVIDTGVTPSARLPHMVAGGDYVMGQYGDGLNDCDGHGTVVASLIGASPSGEPLPSQPAGVAIAPPPPGAPAPLPVPPPPPPPTVTVTASPKPTPAPPPPPAPPADESAPAWGEGGEPVAPVRRWGTDRTDGQDGFVGGAPDAVIVSVRQSSQKFSATDPTIEQDPERAKRAGDVHTLAEAIVRLANMGVKVINISVVSCQPVANMVADDEIGRAVRYAADTKDVLIVSAAGNQGQSGCTQNPDPIPADTADPFGWGSVQTVVTPGWYDKYVLTVSATDNYGAPLTGQTASLHGPWVSLAAPGGDIEGLSTSGQVINASVDMRSMAVKPLLGSSFASAIVSAVAAQVRAKFPDLSAAQVRHRLEASAYSPAGGRDSVVGYGVINPVAALTWNIPNTIPPRITAQPLAIPAPVPPQDPRPGHSVLWGGLLAVATAWAIWLTLSIRRRRRQERS